MFTSKSEENPYFSHYLCRILGSRDVAFKIYTQTFSELLEMCGYHHFLYFATFLNATSLLG